MMKKRGEIYYNFPAPLMRGFAESTSKAHQCLCDVLYYNAYKVWHGRDGSIPDSDFYAYICNELGLSMYAHETKAQLLRDTKEMREKFQGYNGVYFSISKKMYFDFYENIETTSEEDREGLLAYLAVKSIIGTRSHALTNRFFLASRMNGNTGMVNDLPDSIQKYTLRYWFGKLKTLLFVRYKVAIVTDKNIRGLYVSLKKDENGSPDIVWLMKKVHEVRESRKQSDPLKEAQERAREQLLQFKDT